MKTLKIVIISQILTLFAGAFFAAGVLAQTYGNSCISISSNLSYGSRGSDVYTLQNFLIGQGYMSAGATGYFGPVTQNAVMRFQNANNISATGVVGPITRSAIQSSGCGAYSNYNNYNYNGSYQYPYNNYNTYPYGYNYNTASSVYIYSLSPNYGTAGTQVTINGSGFTSTGNSVLLNGAAIGTYYSSGNSITFAVPSSAYGSGMYQISVLNTNGTSNALDFTLSGSGYNYNLNQYNCTYYNTCGYSQNNCSYYNTCGTGIGTNQGGANAPVLRITTQPSNVTTGSQASWTINVTDPMVSYVTTVVRWGDEGYNNAGGQNTQTVYASQPMSFSISHTYQTAGTYTVIFTATNNAGYQNTITAVVTVSGSSIGTGGLTISSLVPSQATAGTQIQIQGSGFTATGNVVHFGIGGSVGLSAINNSTIYYTIPRYISSCDLVSGSCQSTPTIITPGTYPVYVSNGSGQTAAINFVVQ